MQKLNATGNQSVAYTIRVAASSRQIPVDFIHVAYNWRPRGYNLHATGSHAGTICIRPAATQVQFVCAWLPVAPNFCMRLAASTCKAASFLKARCQKNYLNKKMKTPLKNLRIFATYVLARAYLSILSVASSNLMRQFL
jgi:hypothetical protein